MLGDFRGRGGPEGGKRMRMWLVTIVGISIGAGCAGSSMAKREMGNPDSYFMFWASQANLAEIETGEMAAREGVSREVQAYGEEMVEAHRRANAQLQELAEQRGVMLASRPDQAHREFAAHLAQLDGEAFDREYIGAMVANHAKALAMFEDRARTADDPQLRSWAQQMVPILQEHLDEARSLQREMEGGLAPARLPTQEIFPR